MADRVPRKILVLSEGIRNPDPEPALTVITLLELRSMFLGARILGHIFRYDEARLRTRRLDAIPRPLLCAIAIRFLARKACYFEDEQGERIRISARVLASRIFRIFSETWKKGKVLRETADDVHGLELMVAEGRRKNLDLASRPVYLRTDLVFGLISGGSVAHISGVLNNLDKFTGKPVFLTTDRIPNVREDIQIHVIGHGGDFWDFRELPSICFSREFYRRALEIHNGSTPSFVYQRYSLNNYSGVRLARAFRVPFVLEYNGSEIWVHRHWIRPLKYEALSARIEMLNLDHADLIVVVSRPIKEELTLRGIPQGKILVNPNGVDPEVYSPEIDGEGMRETLGFREKVVIGFIGSFGKWHGAEVLAEAFGRMLQRFPGYRDHVRLLMIGDGMTMPLVKRNLERSGARRCSVLTGTVPQREGPALLAACDILVAPHVPNPDGTPFFGSPTKVFEYMAMGKGIVASNLDQIGEILEHGRTAWMVKPGDVQTLENGMKTLIEDAAMRIRLGKAAREEVIRKHTWVEHTRKIVDALRATWR